jgi:hypothetical protein
MTQRMIMNRIASSMREKAQKSIEAKAIGVKIKREIRMKLIAWLIMPSVSRVIAQDGICVDALKQKSANAPM